MALTMLTAFLGLAADHAERKLAGMTLEVYDHAFMGMSYLRSAQIGFSRLAVAGGDKQPSAEMSDAVLGDLDVAADRAMSPAGRAALGHLRRHLVVWIAKGARSTPAMSSQIEAEFDTIVERFAADGFHVRRATAIALRAELLWNEMILGTSLVAALVITALVSRLIVPAVRRAVTVAQDIAAGRLGNVIPILGYGETADLLRALSTMQTSIRDSMAEIRRLMDQAAISHADALALQHIRLDAALNNMAQGLCLFDAQGRLTVVNHRFQEMFGVVALGTPCVEVAVAAGMRPFNASPTSAPVSQAWDMQDGRSITMSSQPINGGGWVLTYDDISEQRAFERRLVYLAQHDSLTGLANRACYIDHIQRLRESIKSGRLLAVLCLDLDRFKLVNDTLGHQAGDQLLCAVASRLTALCRAEDLVVRLGGDEFVIVQEIVEERHASNLAARLVDAVSEPFIIAQQQVRIGTSVGIAIAPGQDIAPDTLLKRADMALYQAKTHGGGMVRVFEPEMDATIQLRRELEFELRAAIDDEQFELFYQPLMQAGGGISGFEALLRWNHPARGMINPAIFIPIAEECGLIVEIGRWVLKQATLDMSKLPEDLKVAVNVSAVQFLYGTVIADLEGALRGSGLAPGRLEIEITESVLIGEDSGILNILHAVHDLGVRISMDDFGTGYSSLSYLRRFPFDKIKIDRSFVTGLSDHEDNLAIVRAVIGLGRSLRMNVNAEGVETQQQRDLLEREGCNELQGYLISRPVPLAQIDVLLGRHGLAVPRQKALAAA